MSTDLSTPVLLRRIAQLEATVGRLSEDLCSLRSAVSKHWLQLPRTQGVRPPVAQSKVHVHGVRVRAGPTLRRRRVQHEEHVVSR